MNYWNKIIITQRQAKYPAETFVRFVARNYYGEPDRSKVHFLDLGCGAGANSWFLAREGFRVTALDGSEGALASLKHRFHVEQFNADVHYAHSDICEWLYPVSKFNCVLDHNTLCHVEKPPMDKIYGSLISGGKFFSVAPAEDTWKGTLINKGFCRTLMRGEIKRLYRPFEDIKIRKQTYPDNQFTIASWVIEATK